MTEFLFNHYWKLQMKNMPTLKCWFKYASGLALLISFDADAAVAPTLPSVIEFTSIATATYGKGNITPTATGGCGSVDIGGSPQTLPCYTEDGFAVGVVNDPSSLLAHIHASGQNAARHPYIHADSTGFYVRALDGSAFSFDSLEFQAPIFAGNPIYGGEVPAPTPLFDDNGNPVLDENGNVIMALQPISGSQADIGLLGPWEYWEFIGFNTAINPDLADPGQDGTNYSTRIAYQTVANGYSGTLTLDADFHNINALWIHYHGYPQVPTDGISFQLAVDNFQLSQPVPIPGAAWLFASGLIAMLRRRKGLESL